MTHQILEHDNMLAVGKTPWHGLGVLLQEAPATAHEALRIAGLDWTVRRVPMQLESGVPVHPTKSVSKQNDGQWACIVRDDLSEAEGQLGVVGPGYVPYQNSQMADLIDPLVQEKRVTIETCGSLFNGKRVWMLSKFAGDNMTIDSGDQVVKYLMLAHGHDGCMGVKFGFTPIRVVCNNTLTLAVGSNASRLVTCKHTANLETNLETLRDAMVEADEVFELTADQYRTLAARGVSEADLKHYARLVLELGEKPQDDWTSGEHKKVQSIIDAATKGIGNTGKNWWHAYNGVTEYLSWTVGKSQEHRIDNVWLGDARMTNARALELALQLSA